MKTVLLTTEYPPFKGGVANYYGHLVKHWPDREKIEVINHQKGHWLFALGKLNKNLRRAKNQMLLVGQVLPMGTVAYLRYLIKPFNYSVFLHGMDFTLALKKFRKRTLTFLILKKANKIVCANSYVANLVRVWQPSLTEKIIIVNPGISEDNINKFDSLTPLLQEKYQTKDKIVLLSLGRLVKRKGVDNTIKAIASLDEKVRDKIIYLVVGKGEDESYLKNIASKEGVAVTFTGEVGDLEKWSFLDLCDIFVMPSREINGDFEGFGIVYLEANLFAKPVIAGRSGGVGDAVADRESGFLVNPENITEIKEAISFLVEHPEEREQLGLRGRERALNNFLWKDQIRKLYDNL